MSKTTSEFLWQPADQSPEQVQIYDQGESRIVLQVNGKSVPAIETDTVATALLRAGYSSFAVSAKTGMRLSPTCLMGVCFGCICTVDGRPGTQACLEPVRNGQVVNIETADQ